MAAAQLVLYRRDLRTEDHAALAHAMAAGPTVALYVLDDAADGRPLGSAARWWLHHALTRLASRLARLGVPLVLRRGDQNAWVLALANQLRAGGVYWSRRYTPWGIAADTALKVALRERGLTAESFTGSHLSEPWSVQTRQGGWFKVFTSFYKAALAQGEPAMPLAEPSAQVWPEGLAPLARETLNDWRLLPIAPEWAAGLRQAWPADLGASEDRFARFIAQALVAYRDDRNRPDVGGTSALSPYLAFGELSPRQIWHAVRHATAAEPRRKDGAEAFLRELVWRDFSTNLLYHFPELPVRPFQEKFHAFPWRQDAAALVAWQQGRTGYPWIDAGMRQLRATGWMHNRVRMGVASFLTKHLMLSWRAGEAWFWDTLVDADPAQNIANWQWVAGCGADAAPYFRIFNPISQGEKFDPCGRYLKRWQPSARGYDAGAAGISPIVAHKDARERALAAFAKL